MADTSGRRIYTRRSLADRLWEKVDKSEKENCWPFLGSKDKLGYGQISLRKGYPIKAYRAAWIVTYGEIPAGKWILHTCDNPSCVNPHHLYCGTPADNARDKVVRLRGTRRELNPMAKLTQESANAIRRRYKQGGITQQQLADEYNVVIGTISAILLNRTWQNG